MGFFGALFLVVAACEGFVVFRAARDLRFFRVVPPWWNELLIILLVLSGVTQGRSLGEFPELFVTASGALLFLLFSLVVAGFLFFFKLSFRTWVLPGIPQPLPTVSSALREIGEQVQFEDDSGVRLSGGGMITCRDTVGGSLVTFSHHFSRGAQQRVMDHVEEHIREQYQV